MNRYDVGPSHEFDSHTFRCKVCGADYVTANVGRACRGDPKTRAKSTHCRVCFRPLCAELDSYYGHDPRRAASCFKCRPRGEE